MLVQIIPKNEGIISQIFPNWIFLNVKYYRLFHLTEVYVHIVHMTNIYIFFI